MAAPQGRVLGHVFLSVHELFLTYVQILLCRCFSFFVVFICPVWVCVGNKLYTPQIQTLLLLFFIIKEIQKRESFSTCEQVEEWVDVGWSKVLDMLALFYPLFCFSCLLIMFCSLTSCFFKCVPLHLSLMFVCFHLIPLISHFILEVSSSCGFL